LAGMYNAIQVQEMLANQAEISFKSGFKEALDTVVATREYDEGKQEGMKEERERIEKEVRASELIPQYSTVYKIIQALSGEEGR